MLNNPVKIISIRRERSYYEKTDYNYGCDPYKRDINTSIKKCNPIYRASWVDERETDEDSVENAVLLMESMNR